MSSALAFSVRTRQLSKWKNNMAAPQPLEYLVVNTLAGPVTIGGDDRYLRTVKFGGDSAAGLSSARPPTSPVLLETRTQLEEYCSGSRRRFDLPLLANGTEFQKRVWRALAKIGYGRVLTYGELAAQLGNVNLARAVGQAANKNPLPIIVPCHRLVGAGGWIGGFAPGVELKRILLEHESSVGG